MIEILTSNNNPKRGLNFQLLESDVQVEFNFIHANLILSAGPGTLWFPVTENIGLLIA